MMRLRQRGTLVYVGALLLAACGAPPAVVPGTQLPAPQVAATRQLPRVQHTRLIPTVTTPTPPPHSSPAPATQTRTPAPSTTPAPSATPAILADPLTGVRALARGQLTRRPVFVMIDNHPAAYPQVGLARASLTFEAVTEFGLTRFMAAFVPDESNKQLTIGPVRSARTYFVRWAAGFGAVYVHNGGSPQSLDLLTRTDVIENVDSLTRDGVAFTRDRTRQSPHNLQTSLAALDTVARTADADTQAGYLFGMTGEAKPPQTAHRIDYYFLYREDAVTWVYDATTDAYIRLRRGAPARDADGTALTTRNLIVIEIPEEPIVNDPAGRVELQVMGEGRAQLFIGGGMRPSVWRKASSDASLRFFDNDGNEVVFRPGQIWIAAVPNIDQVVAR